MSIWKENVDLKKWISIVKINEKINVDLKTKMLVWENKCGFKKINVDLKE